MSARSDGHDLVYSIIPDHICETASTPVRTVFINGVKAHVKGGSNTDGSVVEQGSPNVFFEKAAAARIGDETTFGYVLTSSPDVFANNR